jgi:hypothetical protein
MAKAELPELQLPGRNAAAEETTTEILLPLHIRVPLLLGKHFSTAPNANEAFQGSERRA